MARNVTAEDFIVGRSRRSSYRALAAAGVLFIGSLLAILGYNSLFEAGTTITNPAAFAAILVGLGVALLFSYRNLGLLVAWAVVVAPVGGALVAAELLVGRSDASPVPMAGSFYGTADLWIPAALLAGSLCFLVGFVLHTVIRSD